MNWSDLIAAVRLDTAYGPPIVLNHPFATTQKPDPMLALLKPQITIYPSSNAFNPIVLAPYGKPGTTKWPQVEAATFIAAGVLLGLLVVGGVQLYRALQ